MVGSRSSTLLFYAIAVIVAIGILSYAGMAQVSTLERQAAGSIEAGVKNVASETGMRMADVAAIMEVAAKLPHVKDTSFAHLWSAENKGVPEDADVEKRQIARDILVSNPDIDAIGFILANGDMYMEEPFSRQQNLSRTNFVARDYFQGAVANGRPYLGEVYISAATGASAAALAVPVYSEDKSLAGVLIAVMNLRELNSRAEQMVGLGENGSLVYIDQNNHEVVYSNELVSADEALSDLQSYKDALAGSTGSRIESVGSAQMHVAYSPVQMPAATWVVLSMQPVDEAFSATSAAKAQMTGAVAAAVAVAAGLGIAVYKSSGKSHSFV